MGHAWFRQIRLLACALAMLLGCFERFLNTGEFTLPANEFHLLGSFRLGFVRVRLNSESKLLCPHGDGGHGFHNDRYS